MRTTQLSLRDRVSLVLDVEASQADAWLAAPSREFETAGSTRSLHDVASARIDANAVTPRQWRRLEAAQSVTAHAPASGPFWSLDEVAEATGLSLATTADLFEVAPLGWPDKPAGQTHPVHAIPGAYLLGAVGEQPVALQRDELEEHETADRLKLAHPGRVHPVLTDRHGNRCHLVPGAVDIWFQSGVDRTHMAGVLAGVGLKATRVAERYGHVVAQLATAPTDGDVLRAVLTALHRLDGEATVRFAEPVQFDPEPLASPSLSATVEDFEAGDRDWPLTATRVAEAHQHTTGSSDVTICVIDSGAWMGHPDLSSRFREDWSSLDLHFALDADPAWASPDERQVAHGTKVAGVLGGAAAVAPDCRLLPFKISGHSGGAGQPGYGLRAEAILAALDAVAGTPAVMNLSWRTSGEVIAIREALRQAAEADVVICSSAGNADVASGTVPDAVHFPSGHAWIEPRNPALLSVGGLTAAGRRASYSYYGPNSVSLMAPAGEHGGAGTGVFTTSTPDRYAFTYGTSFASPHVAGVAALVRSVAPALTAPEVVAILRDTAVSLDEVDPLHAGQLGAGRVDALAAVTTALTLVGGSPPSQPVDPGPGQPVDPETPLPALDLNGASAPALAALPPLTWGQADGIVAHRQQWGPFHEVDDLLLTGCLLPSEVEAVRPLVTVG